MAKVALITGGNGISGSAILEHLALKTSASEWRKIVVTSRTPLQTTLVDERIVFVALNFTKDSQHLAEKMRNVCADVSHAYFTSYVHKEDFDELNRANEQLFANFLDAMLEVAPGLRSCSLQTGAKHYNRHLFPQPWPMRETDPWPHEQLRNFYHRQEEYLTARQQGQEWTWNVIRPPAIIGTSPKPNGMSEALTIVLYLLVCRELGVKATMPTNQRHWEGAQDVVDARLLAHLTIWVSTNPEAGNAAFNVTNGDHVCWKYLWPRLAEYVGAEASSTVSFPKPYPEEGEVRLDLSFVEWAKDKRQVWDCICDRAEIPQAKATWDHGTWGFQDWVFGRAWSGTSSMSRAYSLGFTGYIDTFQSFTQTIGKFVDRRQIPPLSGGGVNICSPTSLHCRS